MVLGSCFGEQVCRIATLGQQLWGTTLGSSTGEQFWAAALECNFDHLSRPAGSFGQQQLWGAAFRSFGAKALENFFGHNFVEQRRGTALGSSFEEQLCTAALKNRSFGSIIGDNFGEQLLGVALGQPLCRGALESSFRKLGSN